MMNELFACDGRVDDEKMYELPGVGTERDNVRLTDGSELTQLVTGR